MLIATKIHPPLVKSNLLNRKHLIDRLSKAKGCNLILITGPAGYGKTSLAAQWIKREKLSAAWYSLDDTDNDFDMFFRYILTSLIEADVELEKILGPLLQDQTLLTEKDMVPRVIHALNTLGNDVYLVLDDYHLIHLDGIHHALARIIRYLPAQVHFVIISRHKLPPSLFRFKFQYDMMEITPDDLRFTEDEAAEFFKQVFPLDLSRNQIHDLSQFAGGWVAGFQIFGLTLKEKSNLENLDETLKTASREVIDYLMNEVVNVQPEKVKQFLYHTAVLYRFNAEVCRHVTGLADAGKILNDLHSMNLFLVPLDAEKTWYRYHQLFSEAVREWVKLAKPGLVEETQKNAARWFAKHNHLEDAFQYALASGDFNFMADLLEDYLLFLHEQYEVAASLRWLSKLPRDVFLRRPLLRLFECLFKMNNMQLVDAVSVLPDIERIQEKAIRHYKAPKKTLCRDLLVYLKTVLDYYEDIYRVDIQKMNTGIGQISGKNRPLAGYLRILMAGYYIYKGEIKSAEAQLKSASTDIFPSESVLAKMGWVIVMATLLRIKGQLSQSDKILQDAFVFLDQRKLYDTPLKFLLYLPMAWIFYQRNQLDKALEYASISIRYAERAGHIDPILQGYFLLSRIFMAKGDLDKAMQYGQTLKSLSKGLDHPSLSDYTDAVFAFLSLSRGETGTMQKKASQRKLDVSQPFSFHFLAEAMAWAIVILSQGRFSETIKLLETLHKCCEKQNMMETVLEIDILHSSVLFLMGEREEAAVIIEKSLSFAEKEGYIRPFLNYTPLIGPLFKHIAGQRKKMQQSTFFRSLLKSIDLQGSRHPVEPKPVLQKNSFDLTERELEILRLMSYGYKNKQIADMAFISINTVKTHTQHIFKKLGVKSRLQAIVKAKDFLHPREADSSGKN